VFAFVANDFYSADIAGGSISDKPIARWVGRTGFIVVDSTYHRWNSFVAVQSLSRRLEESMGCPESHANEFANLSTQE
jgi:hypothetical protein